MNPNELILYKDKSENEKKRDTQKTRQHRVLTWASQAVSNVLRILSRAEWEVSRPVFSAGGGHDQVQGFKDHCVEDGV